MVKIDTVRRSIDELTAERGEKKGAFYKAQFTIKEVLERAGKPNTALNHNYVRHVIRTWYQGSKILPGQGDNGGFIHIKIRSI